MLIATAPANGADAQVELNTLTGTGVPDSVRAQALWQLAQLALKESKPALNEPEALPLPEAESVPLAETVALNGSLDVLGTSFLVADPALIKKGASQNEEPRTKNDMPDTFERKIPAPGPVIRQQFLSHPEVQVSPAWPSNAGAHSDTKPALSPADLQSSGVPEAKWISIQRALERSDFIEAQRLLEPYVASASAGQHARISMLYAKMMLDMAAPYHAVVGPGELR